MDLEARHEAPELARDRDVAPGVAEADRRRDEQGAPWPGGGRRQRAPPRTQRFEASGEVVDQPVHQHGLACVGKVAGAGDADVLRAHQLGEGEAALERLAVVAVALDDEHRAAHAAAGLLDLLPARGGRLLVDHQELDRTVEPVRDGVLDLLGRVRLREHLAEEELEEATMVGADVVAVLLLPPVGCRALFVEGLPRGDAPRVARDEQREPRSERHEAEHALRVRGGDLDRGPHAVAADAGEHGRLGRRGVHHFQAVGRVPAGQPSPRRVRRVGAPVPAAVIDDDAMVAGEVVHLRLPDARVADRGRRQEHDRRLPAAVDLPVQPQAVGRLGKAGLVGLACAGPRLGDGHGADAMGTPAPLASGDPPDRQPMMSIRNGWSLHQSSSALPIVAPAPRLSDGSM